MTTLPFSRPHALSPLSRARATVRVTTVRTVATASARRAPWRAPLPPHPHTAALLAAVVALAAGLLVAWDRDREVRATRAAAKGVVSC
jgi:hypothetical protein